jgi:hypothetical protein
MTSYNPLTSSTSSSLGGGGGGGGPTSLSSLGTFPIGMTPQYIEVPVSGSTAVIPTTKNKNYLFWLIPLLLVLIGLATWGIVELVKYNKDKDKNNTDGSGGSGGGSNKQCDAKTNPCLRQGEICVSNKCVTATSQPCSSSNRVGTCPINKICDSTGRGCINKQTFGCSTSADCASGQVCQNNICTAGVQPGPNPSSCGPENLTKWINWDRVDIRGTDIKQVDVSDQPSLADNCASECAKTPGCTFGVHERSGFGEGKAKCWLKTNGSGEAPLAQNRSTTLRLLPASCSPNNGWVYRSGTDAEGTVLETLSSTDQDKCRALCEHTNGCKAVVTNTDNAGVCKLYGDVRSFIGSASNNLSFRI